MAPLGYIEILDSKGGVAERVAIDSFPITIGRSYGNRVILDDPYVCPMHVEIIQDSQGDLSARDLNSVNGLRDSKNLRVTSLTIHSGTQFRIGHSRLRYCGIDHPLEPALLDGPGTRRSDGWQATIACVAGTAAFLLLCLDSYLGSVERVTIAQVVSEPLATFFMLLIWAGLWSLAGRIVVARVNFSQHVAIACGAIAGFLALTFLSEWLEFLFPIVPALWLVGLACTGVILAALVYGHLGFASSLRRSSRLWAALAVSLAALGVSAISDRASRSKFSNVMEFSGVLKPMNAVWLPTISVERFMGDTQKLKRELDALARKAKPEP